jgi:L-ribulose-5-phosphate 3-epimerase
MRVGVRAHDFGRKTPDELIEILTAHNIPCIQLALAKSFSKLENDLEKLNPGICFEIGNKFSKAGIQIAILGCYIEPAHPDSDIRLKGIERFKEHIRYAGQLGSYVVGTETTDLASNGNDHEIANKLLQGSMEQMLDSAKSFGVMIGIEPVSGHTLYDAKVTKQFFDQMGSEHLQVIFDPANLMNSENYLDQDYIIAQFFDLLGDKIVAVHAKDFIMDKGKKIEVPLGQGILNHTLIYNKLKELKPSTNVLIEGIDPLAANSALEFLRYRF